MLKVGQAYSFQKRNDSGAAVAQSERQNASFHFSKYEKEKRHSNFDLNTGFQLENLAVGAGLSDPSSANDNNGYAFEVVANVLKSNREDASQWGLTTYTKAKNLMTYSLALDLELRVFSQFYIGGQAQRVTTKLDHSSNSSKFSWEGHARLVLADKVQFNVNYIKENQEYLGTLTFLF